VSSDFLWVTNEPLKNPKLEQTDLKHGENLTLAFSSPKKPFHQESPQHSTVDQTSAIKEVCDCAIW
jgi:hypothetical protein